MDLRGSAQPNRFPVSNSIYRNLVRKSRDHSALFTNVAHLTWRIVELAFSGGEVMDLGQQFNHSSASHRVTLAVTALLALPARAVILQYAYERRLDDGSSRTRPSLQW